MNNSAFVQALTGHAPPKGGRAFVEALRGSTAPPPEPFARALRGEPLDLLESLLLEIQSMARRADRLPIRPELARLQEGKRRRQREQKTLPPRRAAGQAVRLSESCTLESRRMCSCRRCVGGR